MTYNNSKDIFEKLITSAFIWYQLRKRRLNTKVGTLILSWISLIENHYLNNTRVYTHPDKNSRNSVIFKDNRMILSGYLNSSSFLMIWGKKDLNLICLGLRNRNCLRQVWILWIPYYKKHFKLTSQFGWFPKNYLTYRNSKNIFENLNVSAFHWYQ